MRRLLGRGRRAFGGAVVLGIVAALAAPAVLPAHAQDAAVSYEALASADGLRLEVQTPGLFLSNLFDGGLPVAQAESNSLGRSQGFAALPYPGESVAAVGSLLLPLLLGLPGLPDNPLQASASYPSNPEVQTSAGAYVMEAQGRSDGAKGAVTAGVSAGGHQAAYLEVSARTQADADTGEVVASSRTVLQGAAVGGLLSIGKVEASAEVRGTADGPLKKTSRFEVEGLSVAGVRLAVTSEGVELLGLGDVPLPDLGLQKVLDGAGIHLEYLQAKEFEGGVLSAGLAITFPAPLAPPYNATITVTLGRARATADVSAVGGGGDPTGTELTDGGTAGFGGAVVAPAGGSSPGRASAPAAAPRTRTVSSVGPLRDSAASFYAVLVAAAIVALLSVALIRRSGGRTSWTS